MSYLGNAPARSFISFERQVFSIVNSQTAYALSHSVTNENDIRLVVNNVVQEPGSGKAYTATGTALTLSAALTNGTDEMYCVFLGRATATSAPGAGSIGTAQLADDAVTADKLASGVGGVAGITSSADATAMTITSAEKIGIGETSPLGLVHIKTADSGAGANGDADELIIENGTSGASAGISILSATNGYGAINFGDSSDDNIGIINYDHPNNAMKLFTNGAEAMRINSDGSIQFHNTPPVKTFDFGTTSNVTIADGGHIEFTSTSGIWFVTEQSQTGLSAILIAGGGQTAVASQIGSSYTNSSSSGSFRFYRPSGQGYYFKNDQGNSCSFGICHMSLRNSN